VVRRWLSETGHDWYAASYTWLTEPLFTVGKESFSAANILKLLLFVIVLIWASRGLRRFLASRVLPGLKIDPGTSYALANLVSYCVMTVGLLVGLQTSGVNLSTLTVIFGALGVGIGFGLQTIAANFISGLIILLERPIQVGDRIQLGELHGRVVRIRARATEVLTNDNIAVIVPNSDFISQRVINWSHGDDKIRIRVPVGVSYESDVGEVKKALLEAAGTVDALLKEPAPSVRLTAFGDSAIRFELLVWTSQLLQRRGECVSRVNFAIHETLRRYGIEIPLPQHELRLRTPIPPKAVETGGPEIRDGLGRGNG